MILNANLIRQRREALGWTQRQLAQHMNVRSETIYTWESGETIMIGADKALTLARLLEVEVGALFLNGDGP